MLIGSGGRLGQECAHSQLNNHPLGFVGRGKVLAQIMWPGMEARLRKSNGQLDAPNNQAVDADGTYEDRNGIHRKAILNRLRFGRDGGLLEGTRKNIARSSGNVNESDANWTDPSGRSDGSAGTTAPDGISTGDIFTSTSTSEPRIEQTRGIVAGQTQVFSFWAKNVTPGNPWFEVIGWNGGENGARVWFNSLTGEVGSNTNFGSGWSATGYVGEALRSDGWTRFIMVVTTAVDSLIVFGPGVIDGDGDITSTVGRDVEIWDWNVESNVTFASSSIPTTTTAKTRAADRLGYSNVGEDIAKAAQGTMSMKFKPHYDGGDITIPARMFSLGATSDGILLSSTTSGGTKGKFRYEVFSGGGLTSGPAPDTLMVRDTKYFVTVSWELDSFILSIDGNQKSAGVSGAAPTAGAQWVDAGALNIGGLGSGGDNVNTKHCSYFVSTEPALSTRQKENLYAVVRKAT